MKYRASLYALLLTCLSMAPAYVTAELTGFGKIKKTEGHFIPDCRRVVHVENDTGIERAFRIHNAGGHDDVQSIILMSIATNKDVRIWWIDGETTTCGTEPKIKWIEIFGNNF